MRPKFKFDCREHGDSRCDFRNEGRQRVHIYIYILISDHHQSDDVVSVIVHHREASMKIKRSFSVQQDQLSD